MVILLPMARWVFASLLAVSWGLWGGSADARVQRRASVDQATELSDADQLTLMSGRTVSRKVRFSRGRGSAYVGGVSYQVVKASPGEVLKALSDVRALPHALPRTHRAELVSRAGRSARVELTQGKAPFLAKYTVHLEQGHDGETIKFWLDPTRPHDVRDVWGYFRVTSFGDGKSLVTVAVALDLGPGLARMLFEDGVERIILRAPDKIRAFVEPRAVSRR
jgi:hypothetical protein